MPKQVMEVNGVDVKVGDKLLKFMNFTNSHAWVPVHDTLSNVIELHSERIWVQHGTGKTWWDLNRKYEIERDVEVLAFVDLEVTGDQLQFGDVMLGWYGSETKHFYSTDDSRRDWTLVVRDTKYAEPYMEMKDGGRFQATSDRKYKIRRKTLEPTVLPCIAPVEDLTHKQLLASASLRMYYRDHGRTDCPNGESVKLTDEERAAWSLELRNKVKIAEEKERNRVQVDLDFEPWE